MPVTQVDSYKGLVFASWDPTAPPLLEYIGDFRFYFDAMFDRDPLGTEVIGGVHKWVFKGNWKFAAEQFCSDMYHAPISHASAVMAMATDAELTPEEAADTWTPGGRQFTSAGGHGTGFFISPMERNGGVRFMDKVLREYYVEQPSPVRGAARRSARAGPDERARDLVPVVLVSARHEHAARVASPRPGADGGVLVDRRREVDAARGEGGAAPLHAAHVLPVRVCSSRTTVRTGARSRRC